MTEMAKTGLLAKIKSSLWGMAAYSYLTGFVGTMLLVLFFTGLMPVAATLKYLPWILAFNASVAGYTFLDGAANKLRFKKLSGAGIAVLVAVMACGVLQVVSFKVTGIGLIEGAEMLFFIIVAAVFGGFGAWLAVKYASIKGS